MRKALTSLEQRARLAAADVALERLLHDLKQPLNFIKIVAQDIRLDATRHRLDLSALPRSLAEIEAAVEDLAGQIDQLRGFVRRSLDSESKNTE